MGEISHKPLKMIPIIVAVVAFVVCIFFNAMSSTDVGRDIGIYKNSTGDISDKYYSEITPAGWTFSIWGFIYTYQALFLIYALSTICRKNEGGYLYYSPGHMSPVIYIVYTINLALNVTWLILWDREHLIAGLPVLALTAFTLYICIFFTMRGLHKYKDELVSLGHTREVALVTGVVLNGLAMYATWTTIATLLNLAAVLTYELDVMQTISASIALCVLTLDIVVFVLAEHVLFEKYFRHIYTPYIVLHVAFAGSLAKNWDLEHNNTIYTLGLLAAGTVLTIFKITRSIYKSRCECTRKGDYKHGQLA